MRREMTPNDFSGSDSERIERALMEMKRTGGHTLVIPQREAADGRRHWLLDRAILLDSDTTLVLDHAVLQLSDRCRDNAIRTANCGLGIEEIRPLHDIHVIGLGKAVIRGAERPRATGDSAKRLGERSYGTDAGKEGEYQFGNWQNIGILFAHVTSFSVENITVENSHCWAMSFERCTYGRLMNLAFWSKGGLEIDGTWETVLNQDGIDLRQGCHDILIDGVTGCTGDDLVALTAIPMEQHGAGRLDSTMVSSMKRTADDDIRHIVIRNVMGSSLCQIVRFLNTGGIKLHHVVVDTLMDTSEGRRPIVALRIGDANPAWGGVTPLGDTYGIVVNQVQSQAQHCILVPGSLKQARFTNIMNFNPDCEELTCTSGAEYLQDVVVNGHKLC